MNFPILIGKRHPLNKFAMGLKEYSYATDNSKEYFFKSFERYGRLIDYKQN